MIVKEINRNIRFESRKPESKYKCEYNNRNDFDILRINIKYNGEVVEVYEVESHFLPPSKSIHFNARPTEKGFEVFGWTAKVAPFIRKV
ncbi:MAG: hypothetical protein K2K64_11070 [Muribaculaceae bacterium]|nr:hypothetical protein [Muribaculaceae bacterium]